LRAGMITVTSSSVCFARDVRLLCVAFFARAGVPVALLARAPAVLRVPRVPRVSVTRER
jgi:hypothetical protein